MSFITIDAQDTNRALITENGSYRVLLGRPSMYFSVMWTAPDIEEPEGHVAFTVDGESAQATPIWITRTGAPNSRMTKMVNYVWFIDIVVTEVPQGGSFVLMCA